MRRALVGRRGNFPAVGRGRHPPLDTRDAPSQVVTPQVVTTFKFHNEEMPITKAYCMYTILNRATTPTKMLSG